MATDRGGVGRRRRLEGFFVLLAENVEDGGFFVLRAEKVEVRGVLRSGPRRSKNVNFCAYLCDPLRPGIAVGLL